MCYIYILEGASFVSLRLNKTPQQDSTREENTWKTHIYSMWSLVESCCGVLLSLLQKSPTNKRLFSKRALLCKWALKGGLLLQSCRGVSWSLASAKETCCFSKRDLLCKWALQGGLLSKKALSQKGVFNKRALHEAKGPYMNNIFKQKNPTRKGYFDKRALHE